jgi:hypothetical protein
MKQAKNVNGFDGAGRDGAMKNQTPAPELE